MPVKYTARNCGPQKTRTARYYRGSYLERSFHPHFIFESEDKSRKIRDTKAHHHRLSTDHLIDNSFSLTSLGQPQYWYLTLLGSSQIFFGFLAKFLLP